MKKEEILKKLKEINKKKYSILKLGLFGSFSKNSDTANSDIDILVKMEFKKGMYQNFCNLHKRLEEIFQKKVDLVDESMFEYKFKNPKGPKVRKFTTTKKIPEILRQWKDYEYGVWTQKDKKAPLIILISGTATTTVDKVENGSPAQIAGLKQGDKIEYISGKKIEDWNDVSKSIGNKGKKIEIKVSRNGKYEIFKINPRKEKDRYVIGITPVIEKSPSKAIIGGFKSTWYITRQMYKSLGMLASGNVAMKDVSGPVGMIGLVHQSAARGLISFFYLVALISLNLAIFNLLPLPALDGGRIIFVIIRMITGKAITDKQEAMVHGAGMVLLLSLMVFVTWNDIIKLFK